MWWLGYVVLGGKERSGALSGDGLELEGVVCVTRGVGNIVIGEIRGPAVVDEHNVGGSNVTVAEVAEPIECAAPYIILRSRNPVTRSHSLPEPTAPALGAARPRGGLVTGD